jgi:hypothetical protein
MPITLNGTSGLVTPGMTLGSSVVTVPSGSAPSYTCRAWVNFNGTGTVAIRASGNVSSITDNGTGLYTVNFTTAMPDANYAVVGLGMWGGQQGYYSSGWMCAENGSSSTVSNRTTSSVRVVYIDSGPAQNDTAFASVTIFR